MTRRRQQEGFGHQQADDSPARCAERSAQRHLPGPSRGLCQEQVGEIDAGDEQQRTDRTDENPECAARVVARPLLAHGNESPAHAAILIRMTLGEDTRHTLQIGAGRLEGDTGLETADALHLPARALRVRLFHQRPEELCRVEIRGARWQHADHFVPHAIEHQRPANDARVPAESLSPAPVREDDNVGILRRRILALPQQPAGDRRHPDDAEEPGTPPRPAPSDRNQETRAA